MGTITEEKANKVYDILVSLGSAREDERGSFVYNQINGECSEWRFCGNLGFGGKYRAYRNTVDCYKEDLTEERIIIIDKINSELSKI